MLLYGLPYLVEGLDFFSFMELQQIVSKATPKIAAAEHVSTSALVAQVKPRRDTAQLVALLLHKESPY